jgi:hypothetical protein
MDRRVTAVQFFLRFFASPFGSLFIGLGLLIAFAAVSTADYHDSRELECQSRGHLYDSTKDKCYGKTQENRPAS